MASENETELVQLGERLRAREEPLRKGLPPFGGEPPSDAGRLMRHTDIRSTMRHSHLSPGAHADAVNVLDLPANSGRSRHGLGHMTATLPDAICNQAK